MDFPAPTLARKAMGSNKSLAGLTKAALSFAGRQHNCHTTKILQGVHLFEGARRAGNWELKCFRLERRIRGFSRLEFVVQRLHDGFDTLTTQRRQALQERFRLGEMWACQNAARRLSPAQA